MQDAGHDHSPLERLKSQALERGENMRISSRELCPVRSYRIERGV
jgi:hypothetical protein